MFGRRWSGGGGWLEDKLGRISVGKFQDHLLITWWPQGIKRVKKSQFDVIFQEIRVETVLTFNCEKFRGNNKKHGQFLLLWVRIWNSDGNVILPDPTQMSKNLFCSREITISNPIQRNGLSRFYCFTYSKLHSRFFSVKLKKKRNHRRVCSKAKCSV